MCYSVIVQLLYLFSVYSGWDTFVPGSKGKQGTAVYLCRDLSGDKRFGEASESR